MKGLVKWWKNKQAVRLISLLVATLILSALSAILIDNWLGYSLCFAIVAVGGVSARRMVIKWFENDKR